METTNQVWAKISNDISKALRFAEARSDLEMQIRIIRVYIAFQKSIRDTEKPELHQCSYCGAPDLKVDSINKPLSNDTVITVDLKCDACGKTDSPKAFANDLFKILT